MFFARWKPDHVPWTNFFYRASPALCPAKALRHNQGLAQGVGMPGGSCARFKRDTSPGYACRVGRLEEGINANHAGKVFSWPFA